MALADEHCVASRRGMVRLGEAEIRSLISALPAWVLSTDHQRIERDYRFKNFTEALAFVNELGAIAEFENHHPDLALGWGYVRVAFTTHDAGGLTRNDLIMAAKCEVLRAQAV